MKHEQTIYTMKKKIGKSFPLFKRFIDPRVVLRQDSDL